MTIDQPAIRAKTFPAAKQAVKTVPLARSKTFTASGYGRIPISAVHPVVDGGDVAAKSVPGADIQISATVFREGHDLIGVEAVLFDPKGKERQRHRLSPEVNDRWYGTPSPQKAGLWSFRIEAFADLYATWAHHAELKIAADVDVELMLAEGAALLPDATSNLGRSSRERQAFTTAANTLADQNLAVPVRLAAGLSPEIRAAVGRFPSRIYARRAQITRCLWSVTRPDVVPGTSSFPAQKARVGILKPVSGPADTSALPRTASIASPQWNLTLFTFRQFIRSASSTEKGRTTLWLLRRQIQARLGRLAPRTAVMTQSIQTLALLRILMRSWPKHMILA